jgi:hypothetical protein
MLNIIYGKTIKEKLNNAIVVLMGSISKVSNNDNVCMKKWS